MLFVSPPSTDPTMRAAFAEEPRWLALIDSPRQGNRFEEVPGCPPIAYDNGRFSKHWTGPEAWWAWLQRRTTRYATHPTLFAVAPDTPFDAQATLTESTPWLARIRELGVPAAFAAQDGCEAPGLIPWDDLDVLFIAGSYEFKRSYTVARLAETALGLGKGIHWARGNSEDAVRHAIAIGAGTLDGTFLVRAPAKNIERARKWFTNMPHRQPPHVQFALTDLIEATS